MIAHPMFDPAERDLRRFARNMVLVVHTIVSGAWLISVCQGGLGWGFLASQFLLAQCSVAVLLAATIRIHSATLCVAVNLSIVLHWALLARESFPTARAGQDAACWAIVVAVQALLTLMATRIIERTVRSKRPDRFPKHLRRKASREGKRLKHLVRKPLEFGIGTLIIWTTAAAVVFSTMQLLMMANGWSFGGLSIETVGLAALLGLLGAVIAIIWLCVFRRARWNQVLVRSLWAIPCFAGLAWGWHEAVIAAYDTNGIDPLATVYPLLLQPAFVGLSLVGILNHTRR